MPGLPGIYTVQQFQDAAAGPGQVARLWSRALQRARQIPGLPRPGGVEQVQDPAARSGQVMLIWGQAS
jgi:hypothetical protein